MSAWRCRSASTVKAFSEAAGYITSTRVVERDFSLSELLEAATQ